MTPELPVTRRWLESLVGRKLSPEDFERLIPPGEPDSIYCRHCGQGRCRVINRRNGRLQNALECLNCDFPEGESHGPGSPAR